MNNCIFCYKTFSKKHYLKTHLSTNICKSEILKNQLKLYHLALNYIDKKYIIQNTCIFCNKKYSTKYTFERHLSTNCCKNISMKNVYDIYEYIMLYNIKINQTIKSNNELEIKTDRKEYLKKWNQENKEKIKQWKEQNKDKVQLYREKYQQKIKNFIEQNNHH